MPGARVHEVSGKNLRKNMGDVSYNPYKWPYKWVTGVITLLIGVITPLITGRGPPCTWRIIPGFVSG